MLWHTSPLTNVGTAVDILAPGLWHTAEFAKEGCRSQDPLTQRAFQLRCAVQEILGGPAFAWSPVDLAAVLPACEGLPGFQANLGQSCLFLLTLLQPVIA